MIISGSPYSTGWPSSNRICVTLPACGEGIWFMVFIASTTSRGSPAFTTLPISTNGLAVGSVDGVVRSGLECYLGASIRPRKT